MTTNSWNGTDEMSGACDGETNYVQLARCQQSDTVVATQFGFTIDGAATIAGVEVFPKTKASTANYIATHDVHLTTDGGSTHSTANGGDGSGANLWGTTLDYYHVAGAPDDDWNMGLTPSAVNGTGFGVLFNCENYYCTIFTPTVTAYVDCFKVKVTYDLNGQTGLSQERYAGAVS